MERRSWKVAHLKKGGNGERNYKNNTPKNGEREKGSISTIGGTEERK